MSQPFLTPEALVQSFRREIMCRFPFISDNSELYAIGANGRLTIIGEYEGGSVSRQMILISTPDSCRVNFIKIRFRDTLVSVKFDTLLEGLDERKFDLMEPDAVEKVLECLDMVFNRLTPA